MDYDFIEVLNDTTVTVTIQGLLSGEAEEHQVSMNDLRNYALKYRNSMASIRFLGSAYGDHRQIDELAHTLDDFWLELHGQDNYQALMDSVI